jgi:hypothetical protein
MAGLSFITLLSFDYRYAFGAIRSYYDIADEIILGLDADRISWAGHRFEIDLNQIKAFIRQIDHSKKMRLIEGNFHGRENPMANDTEERNELSRQCTQGNWVVQIDSDEILLNGAEFWQWLLATNPTSAVGAAWISVFKTFQGHALVISTSEITPVATLLRGQFIDARWTKEQLTPSPLQLLHYSWGRTPEELKQKLQNWSHAPDFDTDAFYKLWQSVTLDNFQQIRDFHPLDGPRWPALALMKIAQPERPQP